MIIAALSNHRGPFAGLALALCLGALCSPTVADTTEGTSMKPEYQARQVRVDRWYAPARLGLFYTWGMMTGSRGSFTGNEHPLRYDTVAAFEEAAKDPHLIASNLVSTAKRVGARYVIYSAFHSCGRYAVNYPTSVPGFRWVATKDYLGALVEACHREGVHLIVYVAADSNHAWLSDGPHLAEDMRDQSHVYATVTRMIDELIDRHGDKIGGFWFDGNYLDEMGALIHRRLPQGVVIRNNESGWGLNHPNVDFGTTEFLSGPADPPYSRPTGLLKQHPRYGMMNPIRDFNEDIPVAGGWWHLDREDAYYAALPYVKDPTYLVKEMVSSLGQRRQWNYALGIGPMIDGRLPAWFDPMLENMERFMAWAGESIYDTMGGEGSALNPGWWNDGAYGSITVSRSDLKTLYIHVTTAPTRNVLKVQNNGYGVASVVDLRTGLPVSFSDGGVLTLRGVDWDDVRAYGDKVFKVTLSSAGGAQ